MDIPIGTTGAAETDVTKKNTAAAAGSGSLQVFGTPYMIALMEKAASESVLPFLDAGDSTVGILLNITHDAATPLGGKVRAESVVTAVEGRKITFTVTAYDGAGQIGKGVHARFVITEARFLEKVQKRGTLT